MKVVITKRETKEVRPRYRPKYQDEEAVEKIRSRAVREEKMRQKAIKEAEFLRNTYVHRGKNMKRKEHKDDTLKRYIGNPNGIISDEKVELYSPRNPVCDLTTNTVTLNKDRNLHDENSIIGCAVKDTNLVAPLKVNQRLKEKGQFNPKSLEKFEENLPANLVAQIRAMNSEKFDTETKPQSKPNFIPDLLYHEELDRVDSLHNAWTHPNTFVPPPSYDNANNGMTHESLTNGNYYPVNNDFFAKDQFKCYSTTMGLINQMNQDKPAHLKEYDRRMFDDQNMMSLGNVFYQKNENLSPRSDGKTTKDQIIQSSGPEGSPGYVESPQKFTEGRTKVFSKHHQPQDQPEPAPKIEIEYHGKF